MREKHLKVHAIMKRANIPNEEARCYKDASRT
jgi:hypothetical protein